MSEMIWRMAAFCAGLLAGSFYFGGLWWTVRQLPEASHPGTMMLGSFAIRMAGLLLGLYLVSSGDWARIGLYLLGVFAMRYVLVRRWGPGKPVQAAEEQARGA